MIGVAVFTVSCSNSSTDTTSTTTGTTTDPATANPVVIDDSTDNSSVSVGANAQTGIFVTDDFFVTFSVGSPVIFNDSNSYTYTSVDLTVYANDVNDLVQTKFAEPIKFKTSWGSFDTDQCFITTEGACTVTWHSGAPNTGPGCRVAFTVYAEGEESFVDADDDGFFDVTETYTDLEEPFLDADLSGNFTNSGLELIDVAEYSSGVKNGTHDTADGLYNGTLCDNVTTNSECSTRTSTIIWAQASIKISKSMTPDTFDKNKNGNTADAFSCID